MAFTFKQFHVEDDLCPMKVGTDAVLLGAWADVGEAERMLDIGTGSGILALMLAQRSSAIIDAIDIDERAVHQAQLNFNRSPWKNRLHAIHVPVRELLRNGESEYDLIISNPPYFTDSLRSPQHDRNIARHNESLDLATLMHACDKLLKHSGRCCFVIPAGEEKHMVEQAVLHSFSVCKRSEVTTREGKRPARLLLELCKMPTTSRKERSLTVRDKEGKYSDQFKELTKDYYLNF